MYNVSARLARLAVGRCSPVGAALKKFETKLFQ